MHLPRLLLILFPLLLPACCFDEPSVGWDQTSCQLKPGDGLTGDFHLDVHSGGASLRSRTHEETQRPVLGLQVVEVDQDFAEKHALRPFCGLFVTSVTPGGPADGAGIMPGDVLVAVGGTEVFYLATLERVLQEVKVGDPCTLTFTSRSGGRREVQVTTGGEVHKEPRDERIQLKTGPGNTPVVLGVQCFTLPAEWTRRIYGDDKPAVLLGAVELGSPAYRAGLRPGDRLLVAGGHPVTDAAVFHERLRAWGEAGDGVAIEVRGARGERFVADVLLHDYQGVTRFCAPLILAVKSNQRDSRVGVGPLHILSSYRREYEVSRTREAQTSGHYSLGWGLFKYRWSPSHWRIRVLWLISFGSD